jgi:hypothetical protein
MSDGFANGFANLVTWRSRDLAISDLAISDLEISRSANHQIDHQITKSIAKSPNHQMRSPDRQITKSPNGSRLPCR